MLDNNTDNHSSTTSLLPKSQKSPLTTCSQIKSLTIKYFQTHTHLTKPELTTYLTEVGLSSDWSTDEEKNCLWEYFTKSNPSQPHVDLESVLSVIDYIFSKDNGDISIDYDALEYDSDNNECSSLHISQLTDNIPQPPTYANVEGYINIIHSKSLLVFIKLINEILCYQCKDKETIVINIKEFYIRIKEKYRFILISKKEFDKYFKVITCVNDNDNDTLLHATTTTTTQVKVNIDRNVINFVNQLLNVKLLSNANDNANDNTLCINYSEGNLNVNKYGSVVSYKHIVDKIKYYDQICLDYINALNEFRTNDIIFNILINSFTNFITSKKSFYEQALTSITNIDQQCNNTNTYYHRKSVSMPNNNTLHCKHPLHSNNTIVHRNDLFFSVNTQFEYDDYRQRSNTKIDKKKKTKFHPSKSNNTIINDDSSRKENTIVKLEEYTFSNDDMFSKGDTMTEKYLFETTQMNETNMLINDDNENKKSKGIFSSHNYSIQGDNDNEDDDVNQNENESFTHSNSKCKVNNNNNNNIQCDNNIQMSLNVVDTSINKNVYLNNNNSIKEEDDEYNPKNDSIGNNSIHNNNNNNNNSAMLVNKQNVHCYCYCCNHLEQFQRENYLQQDTLNNVNNKCSPLYYYYDFLSLHNHHSITQILSTKGDNIIPNELFSDDMFYINDKGKYKKIKLAITSSAFYLFKKDYNNQYILLQYYKQIHLQHIIISSLNNNIISFIFQDNTNPYFIVITFKRFELLFYLRDLYHVKKYGNIKCYNFNDYEEFNGEFVQRFKTYRKRFIAAEKMFRVPSFENSIKSGFLLVYYKNFFSCCFYEKYVVLSSIGLMIFDEPFKLPEMIIPLMGVKLRKKRVIIFQQKCLFCFKLILTCQQPITSFLFGSRNSQECEQWRSKINVYLDLYKTKMKSLNIIQNLHLNTYTHSFSNTLSNYFG